MSSIFQEKPVAADDAVVVERVADLLRYRFGSEMAIKIADIQRLAAFRDRRECEEFFELHFADLPFVVCSGTHGYFRPKNGAEINRYLDSLQSRAIANFRRKRVLLARCEREGFPRLGKHFGDPPIRQMELFR